MADLSPSILIIIFSEIIVGSSMFGWAPCSRWETEHMCLPHHVGCQWTIDFDTFLEDRKQMQSC